MRFCLEDLLKTALLIPATGALLVAGEATPAGAPTTEAPHAVSVVRSDLKTGRLIRVVVSHTPVKLDASVVAAIEETARNLQVSPELVHSVIEVESNYNPYAVSPKGAEGLMQLMPATARRFGVTNSFDPRQNIEGGVRYLKALQETFGDDRLAIAAYNAGEKAVTRYGGVPPYPETVNYVAKVGEKYSQAKKSRAGKAAAKAQEHPAPTAESGTKPEEPEQHHVAAYLDAEGRLHIATR
ncbi:MAG TPA: lytic transglycosylase domain-containing protein [Bryobacteraceae bacterium]|nr:lytic transglycosylase domain-containing protein [Bryobacteraceae bacterium]